MRYFSGSQKEFLVLNAVGPDRPGIVSDLTKLVVDQGGNVGGSQAQKLGSHFGLMMLVSVPKNHSMKLQELVNGISDMTTSCYITNDPNATEITPTVGCKFSKGKSPRVSLSLNLFFILILQILGNLL